MLQHATSRRFCAAVAACLGGLAGSCPASTSFADPAPYTSTPDSENSAPGVSQAIDLSFFRKTTCNADQILDAIQKVVPDQWALIKKEPNGSRKQKWVRNWLLMIIGSGQSRYGILDQDEISNIFGEQFWQTMVPYANEIQAVCSGGDMRPADAYGPRGKKAPKFDTNRDLRPQPTS